MNEKKHSPDFRRWATTGVVAPCVVILIVTFAIAPLLWPDLAASLGDSLGKIFLLYLAFLMCAAVVWKIWQGRRRSEQPEPQASQEEAEDGQP